MLKYTNREYNQFSNWKYDKQFERKRNCLGVIRLFEILWSSIYILLKFVCSYVRYKYIIKFYTYKFKKAQDSLQQVPRQYYTSNKAKQNKKFQSIKQK